MPPDEPDRRRSGDPARWTSWRSSASASRCWCCRAWGCRSTRWRRCGLPARVQPGRHQPASGSRPGSSAACVALLDMLAVTSYLHDLAPYRRLLHVLLYVVLATLLASGRIHVASAVRGLAVGLCTSIAMSLAGFGPDNYVGRLTGYLGDPNAGGYVVAVLGLAALGLGSRGRLRYAADPAHGHGRGADVLADDAARRRVRRGLAARRTTGERLGGRRCWWRPWSTSSATSRRS